MKYLRQLLIILIFSFIGEILHSLIPIQVPASIYGLVLLFIALLTGIIQLPQVKEAAKYLIEIMPLMFIPAGVGPYSGSDSSGGIYHFGYGSFRKSDTGNYSKK